MMCSHMALSVEKMQQAMEFDRGGGGGDFDVDIWHIYYPCPAAVEVGESNHSSGRSHVRVV